MNKVLYMTKGLPASGKTSWSNSFIHQHKAGEVVRVNKDDLRAMLHDSRFDRDRTEKLVLTLRDRIVSEALADKWVNYVIVDDTNLAPKHEARLQQLARENNADFMVQDFTDVPVAECIKRDLKRANSVGHKVINRMNMQFLGPKYAPPVHNPELPNAIIVDIDGTLAHHTSRDVYDYSKVLEDTVDEVVSDLLRRYRYAEDGERLVIAVSGRPDTCRDDTEEWFKKHLGFTPHHLFMRPGSDQKTADDIIKANIYETQIEGRYNVEFVLDDRDRVVAMWRNHGLKVLQVGDGDF